jgi:hypothetical protein
MTKSRQRSAYAFRPLPLHLLVFPELPIQCSGKDPFSNGTTLPQLGQISLSIAFTMWEGKDLL